MRIKAIVSQIRRDFSADLECEHCGAIERLTSGYDDDYYHRHVIPAMECQSCGKKAADDYVPRLTRYAAHEVV